MMVPSISKDTLTENTRDEFMYTALTMSNCHTNVVNKISYLSSGLEAWLGQIFTILQKNPAHHEYIVTISQKIYQYSTSLFSRWLITLLGQILIKQKLSEYIEDKK